MAGGRVSGRTYGTLVFTVVNRLDGRRTVKALLDESQLLESLVSALRRAQSFQAATALVTRGGLGLLINQITACLKRGGSGEILIGVDVLTEPEAIQSLLSLQRRYPLAHTGRIPTRETQAQRGANRASDRG